MHVARHARTNALSSRLCTRSCRNAIVSLILLLMCFAGYFFINQTIRKDNQQPTPKHRLHTDINSKKKTSSTNLSGGLPHSNPTPVHFLKDIGGVRNQTIEYEFVIAHYNEGLDWLRPIANHSHVYHKGPDKTGPPFEVLKWETLPNVGREAHTYLYHIIQNYGNLADLTVFLQGHSLDGRFCFPQPADFLTNAKRHLFCRPKPRLFQWGRLNHFGKWLADLQRGKMRRARLTLGGFYEAVFGTQHPASVPKCLAGCFAATREMIRQHPIDLYRRAISFIDDHPNPEEGHYMERLWAAILHLL